MKFSILLTTALLIFSACNNELKPTKDGRIHEYDALIKEFKNPGPDYRSAPLWVWNTRISKKNINSNLKEFKKQGIGGVFIHPRPGLITEYLSEEWFELVDYAIDKGKEMDMKIWIYDENSYPSGFAGGHVYNEMPESYNQGVMLIPHRMQKLDLSRDFERVKFVFKHQDGNWINITSRAKKEEGREGDYVVYELRNDKPTKWYAGFSYVDILEKGVTEKFIDITMSGYEKVAGNEFGKVVPGVFSDEPNIGVGGIRWTPDLFDEFKKKWGYSLKDELLSLTYKTGDWKKVRHNYQSVLLDLFIERWARPYYEYAEENNLIWTGHYWENMNLWAGPDNMAMYAWHQMPGIDMLFNSLEERPDQFGNNLAVKELSSIANQFERHRTLSESYGGAGWELRFEDMKRLGDWEFALGVNFLNQHLFHMSLAGARKHDYPPSFFQEPYWHLYKYQTDYFARLSLALSSGRQINKTLILKPTTTAWMHQLKEIRKAFKGMIDLLEEQQVEYDLGSENVIKDHGKVNGKNFIVNKRTYDLVIIPELMQNIDKPTFNLLKKYIANGGRVMQIGNDPQLVDGQKSEALVDLIKSENWVKKSLNKHVIKELLLRDDFMMTPSPTGRIHHNRRQYKDGQVIFISNFSLEESANTQIRVEGASVEGLSPKTGESYPLYYEKKGNELHFSVHLPPGGSYMAYVHDKKVVEPANKKSKAEKTIVSSPESKVEVLYPNVLNIDYVTLNLMGKDLGHMYYVRASDKIYKHFGYKEGNPWREVQYKTEFLDKNKNHQEGDRFEVSYFFDLTNDVDKTNMKLVVERASLYNISLNGKTVKSGGETWLDPDFNSIDIADEVKTGRNEVKLKVTHFDNRCEIAPIYILGNFSLKSADRGWDIIPAKDLYIGSWKNQGSPFYSESVKYTKEIAIDNSGDYEIELPQWKGTVAEIMVNGKSKEIIQSQPYTKKIALDAGKNKVSVVVYGSLKNLLGPHHVKVRGFLRPSSFRRGPGKMPPGKDYDLFDYGLMEDFRISRLK